MKHNILVVAAHSDDEVLGCGGTIKKLSEQGHNIAVIFMTDGVSSRQTKTVKSAKEHRRKCSERAAAILGISEITQLDFPDNSLDKVPLIDLVQTIEKVVLDFRPTMVFTHYLHDLNIDHSIVSRATLTATRPYPGTFVKKVMGFEVNSSTEWAFGKPQFSPNYFVNISDTFPKKIDALLAYTEEIRKAPHPRSVSGISALATYRGSASGFEYSEAFKIYRFLEL